MKGERKMEINKQTKEEGNDIENTKKILENTMKKYNYKQFRTLNNKERRKRKKFVCSNNFVYRPQYVKF